MTKEKINISLWLHEGEPEGATTWWNGEVFLSVIPFGQEAFLTRESVMLTVFKDLRGEKAVFLLIGNDPASDNPLLYLTAGVPESVEKELLGLLALKESPFNRLILLGFREAEQALHCLDRRFRQSGRWNLIRKLDPTPNNEDEIFSEPVIGAWGLLLKMARLELPGLCEPTRVDTADLRMSAISHGEKNYPLFFCTGRGSDARAKLERNGLRVLAGSRSSPLDATPSLSQPYRETIKRLVDEEKLKKIDGVWTFVEDVKFASSVLAASILMRTATGANSWKTAEGEELKMFCSGNKR